MLKQALSSYISQRAVSDYGQTNSMCIIILEVEKIKINFGDLDPISKVTGVQRMLKNALPVPCSPRDWMD